MDNKKHEMLKQSEYIIKQYFLATALKLELDPEILHDDLDIQAIVADIVAKNWHNRNVKNKLFQLLVNMETEDIISMLNIMNNNLNKYSPTVNLDEKIKWANLLNRYLIDKKINHKNNSINNSESLFKINSLTDKITQIFKENSNIQTTSIANNIYPEVQENNSFNDDNTFENINEIKPKRVKKENFDGNYNVIKKNKNIGLNIKRETPAIRINTSEIAINILKGVVIPMDVIEKIKNNKKMLKAYLNTLAIKIIVSEFKRESIFKDSLVHGINFLSSDDFMEFIGVLNYYYKQISINNNTSQSPKDINDNIDLFNKRWFVFIANNKKLDPVLKNKITDLLSEKIAQEKGREIEKATNVIAEMFNIKQFNKNAINEFKLENFEIAEIFGKVFYKKILEIGVEMLTENEHYDNLVNFLVETIMLNYSVDDFKIVIKEMTNEFNNNSNKALDLPADAKTTIVRYIKEFLTNNSSFFNDENDTDQYIASIIDIITGCDNINDEYSYTVPTSKYDVYDDEDEDIDDNDYYEDDEDDIT